MARMKPHPDSEWSTYDANVQGYRQIYLSSQSIFLAVGAIFVTSHQKLVIIMFAIALVQICLWLSVISARHKVVDFHKYSLYKYFDENGEKIKASISSALDLDTYVHSSNVRKKIGIKTWRRTRIILDICCSALLILTWLFMVLFPFLRCLH